jgi:hypothetical protein
MIGGPAKQAKGHIMLYLRTASGGFINAATIVQLSPERGDGSDEITGWIAICGDGTAVALAAYYATPQRIEDVLDDMPAVNARAVGEHGNSAALPCLSENCPCA